jgi:ArsR family transcriptional regulator, arsenate/arsenite/antimonite-responsive transcriptional repressor
MGTSSGTTDVSMDINVLRAAYRNIDVCQYVVRAQRPGGRDESWTSRRSPPAASRCSPLGEDEAAELAAAFKVLADPARLRLLSLIANAPGGEGCACDLIGPLGRSQPTVSHHLSVLTDAGLVTREKRGKWAWYRVVPERLAVLRDALSVPGPD